MTKYAGSLIAAFLTLAILPLTAKAQETPLAVGLNANAPKVLPIKGGFYVEWPALTEIGGITLKNPPGGAFELMFDRRLDSINQKPEPASNPDVLLPLADYWIVRGKPERAIPLYRRGLDGDPTNLLFQNNLAMLLSDAEGNHPEALQMIDEALKDRHDNVVLLVTNGMILMTAGRADEAIPVLQRAVELSCQHPIYCLHLSKALDMADHSSSARNWFDKSRTLLESGSYKMTPNSKKMFEDLRLKYPSSGL